MFDDRTDAGRQLAARLLRYRHSPDTIILALPRGGVAVGFSVHQTLGLPLDVFITRKLRAPENPEFALGALTETGDRFVNPEVTGLVAGSWGETTHFSVVDGDGMAVAATASINAFFGARAASPELGFLYNDYMREFVLSDPSHPFALRGGAMPYSSMSPTIVGEGGVPALVAGSPGSARIPSAVAQVIQLWIDEGLPVDEAVAAPRLHVVPDDEAYVERTAVEVADALARAGYRVVAPEADLALGGLNAYFGGVHALARGPAGWNGAADPRRDGAVRRAAVGEPPRH